MNKFNLYLSFIFLLPILISAQAVNDSLLFFPREEGSNILQTGLRKELNTYNFNSTLQYGIRSGRLFLGLREQFKSTVNKSETRNIKDEQYLSMLGEYQLHKLFNMGIMLKNNIYSDDRKLDINQASILQAPIFIRIKPQDNIYLMPFGGPAINQQIGEEDHGYIYGAQMQVDKLNYGDINLSTSMNLLNEDISPRKNLERSVDFRLDNKIEDNISNMAHLSYEEQKRDFYFNADSLVLKEFNVVNNIQSRRETSYSLGDNFIYNDPGSDLSFDFDGRLYWRNIERETRYVSLSSISNSTFDTDIEEFKIDFNTTFSYKIGVTDTRLRVNFTEREEKHSAKRIEGINEIFYEEKLERETQKNNKSQQASVSISSIIPFSSRDNLALSIFHRKLIYDTPSDENFDDRDELLTIFRLYYLRTLNPFFDYYLNLEGSLNHIVYIFAERSSNNNIKRVLKLSSGGIYKGKNLRSKNGIEVSANYTVYDFEEFNPNFKSYSFRQFSAEDSTNLKLNNSLSLDFEGYLKFSEQGDFDWSDFSGKPVRFLTEVFAQPKFNYKWSNIIFGMGLRYFSLSTFRYDNNNTRYLDMDYKSIGPVSEITYVFKDQIRILFSGWYEFITTDHSNSRELANMHFSVQWKI